MFKVVVDLMRLQSGYLPWTWGDFKSCHCTEENVVRVICRLIHLSSLQPQMEPLATKMFYERLNRKLESQRDRKIEG